MFVPKENPTLNNFTYVLINGGLETQSDTVDDDVEANLDAQYAMSLSYLTPTNYYSTGGLGKLVPDLDQPNATNDQNEPYLDFLHYILALPTDELPKTLTTSYGEDEQSVPEPYTNATCSLFAQLGARGVSVLFSSGDNGVSHPTNCCGVFDLTMTSGRKRLSNQRRQEHYSLSAHFPCSMSLCDFSGRHLPRRARGSSILLFGRVFRPIPTTFIPRRSCREISGYPGQAMERSV